MGSRRMGLSDLQDNQRTKVVKSSTLSTSSLYPQEIFLFFISVRNFASAVAEYIHILITLICLDFSNISN